MREFICKVCLCMFQVPAHVDSTCCPNCGSEVEKELPVTVLNKEQDATKG